MKAGAHIFRPENLISLYTISSSRCDVDVRYCGATGERHQSILTLFICRIANDWSLVSGQKTSYADDSENSATERNTAGDLKWEHKPKTEHLEWNSWLVDGVFVDIKGHYWVGNREAVCHFWIGLDSAMGSNIDIAQLVQEIVAGNNALGIKMNHVEQYTHPINIIGKGLQHIGLMFSWRWTVTS